jgi:hypothetical protein
LKKKSKENIFWRIYFFFQSKKFFLMFLFFSFSLRPFLFLFVVSEEININGVCVCLFVSMCIRRSTNGFQVCVCVVCTLDSFGFFFLMLRCTRIHEYIHIYITESVRGLTKEREREKVKKKSNTSTAKPRSRSLLYTYVSLPRLTSSSSLSFGYHTQKKKKKIGINYFDRVQIFYVE